MPIYSGGTQIKGLYGGFMRGTEFKNEQSETKSRSTLNNANALAASARAAREQVEMLDFMQGKSERRKGEKLDNEGKSIANRTKAADLEEFYAIQDSRQSRYRANTDIVQTQASRDAAEFDDYTQNTSLRAKERDLAEQSTDLSIGNLASGDALRDSTVENKMAANELELSTIEQDKKNLAKKNELLMAQVERSLVDIEKMYSDENLESIASAGAAFDDLEKQGATEEQSAELYNDIITGIIEAHPLGVGRGEEMLSKYGLTAGYSTDNVDKLKALSAKTTLNLQQRQAERLLRQEWFYRAEISAADNATTLAAVKPRDSSFKDADSKEINTVGDLMSSQEAFNKLQGKHGDDGYTGDKLTLITQIAKQARQVQQFQKIGGEIIAPAEMEAIYGEMFVMGEGMFVDKTVAGSVIGGTKYTGNGLKEQLVQDAMVAMQSKILPIINSIPNVTASQIWQINRDAWMGKMQRDYQEALRREALRREQEALRSRGRGKATGKQ